MLLRIVVLYRFQEVRIEAFCYLDNSMFHYFQDGVFREYQ